MRESELQARNMCARKACAVALVVILTLLAVAATGCSASNTPHAQNDFFATKPASTTNSKMASMAKSTATGMKCAECTGHGKGTPVTGTATIQNGVQVIKISLKDGRYVPNEFQVQSFMPVRVSFEGTATGCLGHPTFKSLNKTLDITTAPATVDLGTLKPGTYKFTCAMGMNSGTISVQ